MSSEQQNSNFVRENFLQILDEQWQRAIVGLLFTDSLLYWNCTKFLKVEWFANPNTAEIARRVLEYVSATQCLPGTVENLYNAVLVRAYPHDHERLTKYRAEALNCIDATKTVNKQALKQMLTLWMKVSLFQNVVHSSVKTFNQNKYEEAITQLNLGLKNLNSSSFMEDGRVAFNDGISFFTDDSPAKKICATLGHPMFDQALTSEIMLQPESKVEATFSSNGLVAIDQLTKQLKGSLRRGDSTVLMGPSNAGKTTTMVSIIMSNILLNKKVLFITHEGAPEDIKVKLYSSLTGYTPLQLSRMNLAENKKVREIVPVLEQYLARNLVYIPWMRTGDMYVEQVVALIKEKQEELKAINNGQGFDLVIDDYPAKLKSKALAHKRVGRWEEARDVYSEFMLCAQELQFHGIWPVQCNREGFRINQGGSDARLLDMSDVAESFGICQDASNVITINRSPEDDRERRIRYFISKCRGAMAGHVFLSSVDLALSRTFHLSLASQVYHRSEAKSKESQKVVGSFRSETPASPPPAEPPSSELSTNFTNSLNKGEKK